MTDAEPAPDKALCRALKEFAAAQLAVTPELRSVTVVLDWYGGLNDAPEVQHGVWVCSDGPVSAPDAVVGSALQTLRVLQHQIDRMTEVTLALQGELTRLAGRVVKERRDAQAVPGGDRPETAG